VAQGAHFSCSANGKASGGFFLNPPEDVRARSDPEVTLHALADEILRYRQAMRLLATAISWADAAAPFGLIGPGPLWRPRRTNEGDGVPPAA
jgi:hypothetical protein